MKTTVYGIDIKPMNCFAAFFLYLIFYMADWIWKDSIDWSVTYTFLLIILGLGLFIKKVEV